MLVVATLLICVLAAVKSHFFSRERGSFDPTVNFVLVQNLLVLSGAGLGFESVTLGLAG